MRFLTLVGSLVAALTLAGCFEGPKGDPGPAGAQGPQGEKARKAQWASKAPRETRVTKAIRAIPAEMRSLRRPQGRNNAQKTRERELPALIAQIKPREQHSWARVFVGTRPSPAVHYGACRG